MNDNIGQIALKGNLISSQQYQKAVEEQKVKGGSIGASLIRMGMVREDDLLSLLSRYYKVPSVKLSTMQVDKKAIELVPASMAKKHLIVPISRVGAKLTIAMVDPNNFLAIDEIKFITSFNVEPVVASDYDVIDAIKKYYGGGGGLNGKGSVTIDARDYSLSEEDMSALEEFDDSDMIDVGDFDALVSGAVDKVEVVQGSDETEAKPEDIEAPVIKLVNGILINAIKLGASDIHFEPYERTFRVRFRVDGVLRKALGLPVQIKNATVSRLKIMSKLDIAEKRLPQDGRIKLRLGKREMDFRVSVLPTLFGEKVVLRLLDKSALQLDMTRLGFEGAALEQFTEAIHRPVGMVLVTGPTGSGKTTTLYSALSELNKEADNIITAEDPIEFNFMGINQVQMHEEIGLTFASSLRSFLRQDPDIIMVGEIRDFETAQIAIQAALTGHLVMSTVHTNDAPGTITRLIDMGIEPFLITSSVLLILAQRLVRKVCTECREPLNVNPKLLLGLGIPREEINGFTAYKGKGCSICSNTGYKGRIGLYEVMPLWDEVKELVLSRASTVDIKREMMRLGMKTLRMAGITKIKEGMTTIEEILRTTMDDRK
jgi:type IV pilus assembly protein PilB